MTSQSCKQSIASVPAVDAAGVSESKWMLVRALAGGTGNHLVRHMRAPGDGDAIQEAFGFRPFAESKAKLGSIDGSHRLCLPP